MRNQAQAQNECKALNPKYIANKSYRDVNNVLHDLTCRDVTTGQVITLSSLVSGTTGQSIQCGTDASIDINACISAAILKGGGTCDASACGGTRTNTKPITVGNSSLVPVRLILPNYAIWQWSNNIGTGRCALEVYGKSAVIGFNAGEGSPFLLQGNSGFSGDSLFCTKSSSPVSNYYRVDGVSTKLVIGATALRAAVEIYGAADLSQFDNIYAVNSGGTAPIGVWVHGNCCATTLRNIGAEGNSQGNWILGQYDSNNAIHTTGFSFVHPSTGQPALFITGGAATGNQMFESGYAETSATDLTTSIWKVDNGVIGLQTFLSGRCNLGTNASRTSFCIENGTSSQILAMGLTAYGIPDLNAILDHANGVTVLSDGAHNGIAPFYSTQPLFPSISYSQSRSAFSGDVALSLQGINGNGDNFHRADSATTLGTTTTGQTWSNGSGIIGLSGNLAYLPSATNSKAFYNSGLSDIRIMSTIAVVGTNSLIMFRYTDVNNYWCFGVASGTYRFRKVVGGVVVIDQSIANITPAAYDRLEVTAIGNTMTMFVNGQSVYSITDSFNATATNVGLQSADTVTRWSALAVQRP